jgi:thermostable 8-oxoguanine DNA glycosylase
MKFSKITEQRVLDAIPKTTRGLEQYLHIQKMLRDGIPVSDRTFQKAFNGFYRVRGRSADWYDKFYSVFEEASEKRNEITFEQILNDIYVKTGWIEASFSSKIYSSFNENAAVIDRHILQNLDLKLPGYGVQDRLIKINSLYEILNKEMKILSEEKIGKFILTEFFNFHKKCELSDLKALDLTIWQIRTDL